MLELNKETMAAYRAYLIEKECSKATIEKYIRDIRKLGKFCKGQICGKAELVQFKEKLILDGYAVTSINSMLSSVNSYLSFMGFENLKVRHLRVQRTIFADKNKELTRKEYAQLIEAANRKKMNDYLCFCRRFLQRVSA